MSSKAARRWLFVWNGVRDEMAPQEWEGRDEVRFCVWQLECGETGNVHLQGYVEFSKLMRPAALRKFCDECHWGDKDGRPCFGSQKQNIEYCTKEETRELGPWQFGVKADPESSWKRIIDDVKKGVKDVELMEKYPGQYVIGYKAIQHVRRVLDEDVMDEEVKKDASSITLYGWQLEAWRKLHNQDKRKILWVVDERGNMGKTNYFAKWIEGTQDAFLAPVGKNVDVFNLYKRQEYVVFDFPRNAQQKVQYDLIEIFKDGRVVSTKYEGGKKYKSGCKVVVLANWSPDMSALSSDRWDVMVLSQLDFSVDMNQRIEVPEIL